MFVATTAKSADIMPVNCLLQKRTRKDQRFWRLEDKVERIFWKVMQERNVKPREDPLLSNVRSLQHRVNNLKIDKKKDIVCKVQSETKEYFWSSAN